MRVGATNSATRKKERKEARKRDFFSLLFFPSKVAQRIDLTFTRAGRLASYLEPFEFDTESVCGSGRGVTFPPSLRVRACVYTRYLPPLCTHAVAAASRDARKMYAYGSDKHTHK